MKLAHGIISHDKTPDVPMVPRRPRTFWNHCPPSGPACAHMNEKVPPGFAAATGFPSVRFGSMPGVLRPAGKLNLAPLSIEHAPNAS